MNTALLVAPKEKIGSLMAICVCAVTLGPAFGPIVSGIVLQYFSWHALFTMLIPIIVVASGFLSGTMVAFGIAVVGLILSFAFGREKCEAESKRSIILE